MKAVLLNGVHDGSGETALEAALVSQLEASGYTVHDFVLRDMKIAPCNGCFGCWIRTPGVCLQNDDGRRIAEAMAGSALVVFLTPVTFGGYSSELKKALDRSIPNLLPFFRRVDGQIHHVQRYERTPSFVGIGFIQRPDAEAERIFTTLVERNAINLDSPAHAAAVVVTKSDAARSQVQGVISDILTKAEVA